MKILITDDMHPLLQKGLLDLNCTVDYYPEINNEETLSIIQNYEGLILSTKTKADRVFLDKAHKLKIIGRGGSGMENIDVKYAKEKGIICFNTPEGNCNAVAEHCMALLLNMMNNVLRSFEEIKNGLWNRESNRGEELLGKTAGIIGFGHTGSLMGKKLSSFGVKVLYFDPYNLQKYDYASPVSIETIQKEADIISFHVPLSDETHHIFDANFIQSCTKEVYFINASRGKVMNSASVAQVLENNKIKGLALDVLENEKLESYTENEKNVLETLVKSRKVIITPHIAGWSIQSKENIAQKLLDGINSYIKGEFAI